MRRANRVICTIANRKYAPYLHRFIYSVREAGWRGEIVVLTTDVNLYCNATVRVVKQEFKTSVFRDNRWLKLELDRHFKKGDRVIFLDCDIVLFKGFPFEELFQHDLSLTTVAMNHDVTKEMPIVKSLLGGEPKTKYLASPCAFKMCRKTEKFFDEWRSFRETSKEYNKGTMFALNLACHSRDMSDVYLLPEDRCAYTLTVVFKEIVAEPVLFHYGGGKGKQIWFDEYRDGIVYNYRGD